MGRERWRIPSNTLHLEEAVWGKGSDPKLPNGRNLMPPHEIPPNKSSKLNGRCKLLAETKNKSHPDTAFINNATSRAR